MKRLGIYCIYEPSGEIGESIIKTLIDLKNVVEYIVVVINGIIHNKNILYKYVNEVVVRENLGFDIGAYKRVILDIKYKNRLKNFDELVLCNNSFYGPFISFKSIFDKMEKSKADFWGISSSERNLVQHIQSYFLVLIYNILNGDEFIRYLEEWIDEKKIDYYGACSVFENGLFWMLKKAGYCFDAYKRNIECDNYLNPYGSVKIDKLPILKRKVFSKRFYDEEKVVNALSYVKETYKYDINVILNDAYFNYGIKLNIQEIGKKQSSSVYKDFLQKIDMVSREEIEEFIDLHNQVYIFGNGKMAKHIFSCFFFYENNPKLGGFIVSDDQCIAGNCFRGYPVYKISEIKDLSEKALLLALNKANTRSVMPYLNEVGKIKILWKE